MRQSLLPFCSHNIPKQDETRARTTHQQKTWNCVLSNAFPARSEGYRAWPCCTHNPKVAGSNPAPATNEIKGLRSIGRSPLGFHPNALLGSPAPLLCQSSIGSDQKKMFLDRSR